MRAGAVAILTVALLLGGCDASESNSEQPAKPLVLGDGVIRGSVKFAGPVPEMKAIANVPCHDGAVKELKEEAVIANDNGTLRNVLVYLEGAGRGDGSGREPAVLDQVDCRYEPHVLGVQIGQTLTLRSSDPTLHNVHYTPERNPQGNYGFSGAGGERPVKFEKAEVVRMKCDVHPWMTAYVGVFDNPFFAVTGDDGTFEIEQVPPGEYTLVAWHERYGKLEQPVTVPADAKAVEAGFAYKAPQ